jgi:hypothetical protein
LVVSGVGLPDGAQELKEVVAEQALEVTLLKKKA